MSLNVGSLNVGSLNVGSLDAGPIDAAKRPDSKSSHSTPSNCGHATNRIHATACGADSIADEFIAPPSHSVPRSKPISRATRIGHDSASVRVHAPAKRRDAGGSSHRDHEDVAR